MIDRIFLRNLAPLLVLTLLLAPIIGCGGDDDGGAEAAGPEGRPEMPDTIQLGLIPSEDSEEVLKRYEPLVPWLEEQLGADVKLFVGTDYSATIEALKSGRIDGAFLNSFGYILAADQQAVTLLAAPVDLETGEFSHYHSGIITHIDSGIETLEDLKGKDFGFVDPASTSGHLVPESGLVREGIDPWDEMNPVYAGGHDVVLLSVFNQTLPAGATSFGQDATLDDPFPDSRAERMDEADQIDMEDIRVIWLSDPIPSGAFVAHAGAPDIVKQRLKETMLAIEEDPDALAVFERSYGEASDDRWDPLREAAELLGLDLEELVNE